MSTQRMDSALDAVQVFANSAITVQLFEALAKGQSSSRDLAERTGGARSTVGRILDRGESRGWIESEGSRYELTHLGRVMIAEFRSYLTTVEGIQHLGAEFQWLPEPAHDLEYRHFREATIIKPTKMNPSAPFDRMEELIRTADKFPRKITQTVLPRHQNVSADLWEEGRGSGAVIDASILETLHANPERAEPWYDWAQTGFIWVHEAPQITMMFSDEVVLICLGDVRGDEVYTAGVLESESPAVLSWAESLFEDYRAAAEPLTIQMLPER